MRGINKRISFEAAEKISKATSSLADERHLEKRRRG
jgi:hypothetical protein